GGGGTGAARRLARPGRQRAGPDPRGGWWGPHLRRHGRVERTIRVPRPAHRLLPCVPQARRRPDVRHPCFRDLIPPLTEACMPDRPQPRLAQEPRLRVGRPHPEEEVLDARILDPYSAPVVQGVSGRPTIYVGDRLIVAKGDRCQHQIDILKDVAKTLGWV